MQEIIENRLLYIAKVLAREKISNPENDFYGMIYERGVDEKGFAIICLKGDQVLLGGFTTNDRKRRLRAAENRPLADFMPKLAIKA